VSVPGTADLAAGGQIVETGTPELLARIQGRTAVLTLNRPERRNAMSGPMMSALASTLDRLTRTPQIGCILLTGAGSAFCAGGDVQTMGGTRPPDSAAMTDGAAVQGGAAAPRSALREPATPPAPASDEHAADPRVASFQRAQREIVLLLHETTIPTVAALPGPAAGAGLSLALACDLRIASDRAFITTAFARVGVSGDFGGSWLLSRIVGTARARELYFLSERVDAATCERLGIVHRVVPHADLEAQAFALARRVAQGPTVALGYMKANLNRALHADFAHCLDEEAVWMLRSYATEDHREATRAFLEKREPRFRGR
jgi:enoyl-CoA hydratase/carnithine racemase